MTLQIRSFPGNCNCVASNCHASQSTSRGNLCGSLATIDGRAVARIRSWIPAVRGKTVVCTLQRSMTSYSPIRSDFLKHFANSEAQTLPPRFFLCAARPVTGDRVLRSTSSTFAADARNLSGNFAEPSILLMLARPSAGFYLTGRSSDQS